VESGPEGGDRVQAFVRGLSVITCFDAEHPEMSLSEVARRTGLTRAAARRFLLTLLDLGYVGSDGRVFRLTPRVLDLGYSYLSSLSLPEVARPHLHRLSHQVQESSSVSVLDGGEIVYVARVATRRIMAAAIDVGTRFPAYATSMGRVLLAHLPLEDATRRIEAAGPRPLTPRTLTRTDAVLDELEVVRRNGFAVVDQELEIGLRSLSVGVRDPDGHVGAAVNLSVSAGRFTVATMTRDLLPALRDCAEEISADLLRVRRG
jgi:IclR family pca regulon transcriptional regulator